MNLAVDLRDAFRIHRSIGGTAVALQGLTLQVEEGEIVVVLGPSGSGKTTILRTVAVFDALSAGTVRVLGTDVGSLGPSAAARFRAQNLGLLDQHYARALSPELSCVHTVALSLELLGNSRIEARSTASALLDRVGLGDRLDDRPGTLSGGEQQRVALCAALAHRPRLLLADEPAGELDAENAETVYGLVAEFVRERGATALVVSHDEAAADIADRLVYVRDGRVVEEGRPRGRASLVVTEPGWVRLPDPLLDALGSPRRLHAAQRGGELVITSAGDDADLGVSRPTALDGQPVRPGGVVAEFRDVVRHFPGATHPVLDGISRTFESGTLTAVVGRSGSGKTTLLHLLAGLDCPDRGNVVLQGHEIGSMSRSAVALLRRQYVALVTQEPGLIPHLTVRENVELALLVRAAVDNAGAKAAKALADVGLADRLDHRADRLSAGERQRVAIARALAARPAILLADEPTARLDQANARGVGELFARLARDTGSAVVCATHDAAVIEQVDTELVLGMRVARRPAPGAALKVSIVRGEGQSWSSVKGETHDR
jgi:ABC-type lipoprotein export system ATPase subunit